MGATCYPNYRRGIVWGLIAGLITSSVWFGWCYALSQMEPMTDLSLGLAYRPWWRILPSSFCVFLFFSLWIGVARALYQGPLQSSK